MAAKAKLSILGLYRWNPDVFKNMALPEGVNGETLTWKILEDCAEMEVLYSDAEYMQASIYNWSSAMLPTWQKMQDALTAEYNPIWNKDGKIVETHDHGAQKETDIYGNTSDTYSYGADTVTMNNGSRTGSETRSVAGFNSETFSNAEKTESTMNAVTDTSSRASRSDSVTGAQHTDTRSADAYKDTVTTIEQGNIGVTESSAMVRHEIELRADFNIYSIIANDFKKHYCLMVY